jgi:hypothetical protein
LLRDIAMFSGLRACAKAEIRTGHQLWGLVWFVLN